MLSIVFIAWAWNGHGLIKYVEKKGFGDTSLLGLVEAILVRYEIANSDCFDSQAEAVFYEREFSAFMMSFVSEIWEAIRTLSLNKADDTSQDVSQLEIYAGLFKLHCILQRYVIFFNGKSSTK